MIDEVRGRRGPAVSAIEEHLSEAELHLVAALGEKDAKAYRDRAEAALDREGLARILEELLESARAEVAEKFQELADELEVLGVSLHADTRGVNAVWDHAEKQRRQHEKERAKHRTRGILRSVLRTAAAAAGGVAGALASGGPGAAAGAESASFAAKRLLDAILPELALPSQDREAQLRTILSLVERLKRDATKAFDDTLENGLLRPLEQRLVPPRSEAIKVLTRFVAVAQQHRQALRDPVDVSTAG